MTSSQSQFVSPGFDIIATPTKDRSELCSSQLELSPLWDNLNGSKEFENNASFSQQSLVTPAKHDILSTSLSFSSCSSCISFENIEEDDTVCRSSSNSNPKWKTPLSSKITFRKKKAVSSLEQGASTSNVASVSKSRRKLSYVEKEFNDSSLFTKTPPEKKLRSSSNEVEQIQNRRRHTTSNTFLSPMKKSTPLKKRYSLNSPPSKVGQAIIKSIANVENAVQKTSMKLTKITQDMQNSTNEIQEKRKSSSLRQEAMLEDSVNIPLLPSTVSTRNTEKVKLLEKVPSPRKSERPKTSLQKRIVSSQKTTTHDEPNETRKVTNKTNNSSTALIEQILEKNTTLLRQITEKKNENIKSRESSLKKRVKKSPSRSSSSTSSKSPNKRIEELESLVKQQEEQLLRERKENKKLWKQLRNPDQCSIYSLLDHFKKISHDKNPHDREIVLNFLVNYFEEMEQEDEGECVSKKILEQPCYLGLFQTKSVSCKANMQTVCSITCAKTPTRSNSKQCDEKENKENYSSEVMRCKTPSKKRSAFKDKTNDNMLMTPKHGEPRSNRKIEKCKQTPVKTPKTPIVTPKTPLRTPSRLTKAELEEKFDNIIKSSSKKKKNEIPQCSSAPKSSSKAKRSLHSAIVHSAIAMVTPPKEEAEPNKKVSFDFKQLETSIHQNNNYREQISLYKEIVHDLDSFIHSITTEIMSQSLLLFST